MKELSLLTEYVELQQAVIAQGVICEGQSIQTCRINLDDEQATLY